MIWNVHSTPYIATKMMSGRVIVAVSIGVRTDVGASGPSENGQTPSTTSALGNSHRNRLTNCSGDSQVQIKSQ